MLRRPNSYGTSVVIFSSPDGRPVYIGATLDPEAYLEALKPRWDNAEIGALLLIKKADDARVFGDHRIQRSSRC